MTESILLAENTNDPRDASKRPGVRHRRIELPCSTDLTTQLFTLAEARALLDNPVLDKRYQETPLGGKVARYLRWKEDEWGASPETLRDYEPPLAHLALDNPGLDLAAFTPPGGIELLRECMARHWSDRAPRTKKKIRSIWVNFFEWAIRECGHPGNPARALTIPKARDIERKTFDDQFLRKVLTAQTYPGDWVLTFLILCYGLRRSGIQNIRYEDFNLESRELTVRTKGARIYQLPIVEPIFWRRLGELQLEAQLADDDFLVYRQDTRRRRVHIDEADEMLLLKGEPVGYATVTVRTHGTTRPTGQTVHRWWYRCLERAGLVNLGVTAGANMHRGRHTAGRAMQRHSHDLKLTQLMLGHKDIKTTSIYTDLDTLDLAAALRGMKRDEGLPNTFGDLLDANEDND